jgi:hypothetical protein
MKKIMGRVVFSGNGNPDGADGAAAALRKAGFDVVRMPARFLKLMDIPGDEFLEASKVGDLAAVWSELNAIIKPFDGECLDECGEISDDHVAFQSLYEEEASNAQKSQG